MTTLTFDSKDPEGLLCVLGEASIEFDNQLAPRSKALIDELRDQLRPQVKPVVEEPTGDVAVFRSGWFYKPGGSKGWVRDDLTSFAWSDIISGSPDDLAIYRREEYSPILQQVRDLLFRSPSGSLTHEEAASAYKALPQGFERHPVRPPI